MSRLRRTPARRAACWIGGVCAAVLLISCDRAAPIQDAGPAGSQPPGQLQGEPGAAAESEGAPRGERRVFDSPLAGDWYPAGKQELAGEIDGYLAAAPDLKIENLCALVLPHAGYRWSGATAAHGARQLRNRAIDRVVVIGPSHRAPMENMASVPGFTHYATPLGEVPLDRKFIAELRKHAEFQEIPFVHESEHSVGVQLPLLQRVLNDFQLVPIVVGDLDRATVRKMGRILGGLVDQRTLVVASSDFTHYGANFGYLPFSDDVPEKLKKLDGGAIDRLCEKNLDGFLDYIDQTGATICGRCAIGVLLAMLPADAQVRQLHYETSGRITGDWSSSVSYCAFAVSGKWPPGQPAAAEEESADLSPAERADLLRLARATLTCVLEKKELPAAEPAEIRVTPAMRRPSGAFVTLHKGGQLRGCIGEVVPTRPLYKCVMAQAINAGLNDHRFPPVELPEMDAIDMEISVLTPLRPVTSISEIEIGRHGVVLKKGERGALFLPQVATEQGWDLETTLAHLSQKAGLPEDAWREGASFEVFEAIVFGEKEPRAGAARAGSK